MAENKPRKWLINALRKSVVRSIEARGFENVPFGKTDIVDREFKQSFPFGRFRRKSLNGLHLLDIEFAVQGKAKFRINAGVFPAEGFVDILSQTVLPEEAWVHTLLKSYVLAGGSKRNNWFYVSHWFWQTPTRQQFEDLASTASALIPEIENALSNGTVGPHLKFIDNTEFANTMRLQLQKQKAQEIQKTK